MSKVGSFLQIYLGIYMLKLIKIECSLTKGVIVKIEDESFVFHIVNYICGD